MDQKSDDQKTGKPRKHWVRFEVSAEVAALAERLSTKRAAMSYLSERVVGPAIEDWVPLARNEVQHKEATEAIAEIEAANAAAAVAAEAADKESEDRSRRLDEYRAKLAHVLERSSQSKA